MRIFYKIIFLTFILTVNVNLFQDIFASDLPKLDRDIPESIK